MKALENRFLLFLIVVLVSLSPQRAEAAPQRAEAMARRATEVVVRAKARDGKFIGSSVGGAWVRIRDADSGAVLAEGLTEGETGNTELIMREPHRRHIRIADGAAAFRAVLELGEPTLVTVEVSAPHIKRQARTLSQTQVWLIPGKPISGDGLIIEVPGMIVDVLSPQTHRYARLAEGPFEITANVVMMCGCIFTPGGVWDGNAIEVAALVEHNGKRMATIPLKMQAQMNIFSAPFAPTKPGNYRFTVYAYDPKTGNSGVHQTSFVITP
jgi:hypothetical protein